MGKININTSFKIYTKTILSEYNNLIINDLYLPILGCEGACLYVFFSRLMNRKIDTINAENLLASLNISLNALSTAKKSLESLGLISSYINKENTDEISIVIYSPKSPKKFFDDIILKGLLERQIGHERLEELIKDYSLPVFDKSKFDEDNANVVDVYKIDLNDANFKYDEGKNEVLLDFKAHNSKLKFDFKYFLGALGASMDVTENMFSKDEEASICSIANLYGYNEDFMVDLVKSCYDPVKENLDTKKLQKIAYNSLIDEKVKVAITKQSSIKISSNSRMATKINIMNSYAPLEFLKLKQKNTKPVQSDINLLYDLSFKLGLTNGVINALVDYVLEKNNNILSRNFTEKIAASLVREGVTDALSAMNYLYNSKSNANKPNNIEEKKEVIEQNPVSSSSDDIWNKLKEMDKDEF